MIVRREIPSDHDAVRALVASVYSPELIDGLRASESWLPALSFVALGSDGEVVGHVGTARTHRLGQALMHTVLGAAEALDEPLVGVVAFPTDYYLRFGFFPAEEYAIAAPFAEWQPSFLVRPLTAYRGSMRGTFSFPDPFLGA